MIRTPYPMQRTTSAMSAELEVMPSAGRGGDGKHQLLRNPAMLWFAAGSALLGSYQFGGCKILMSKGWLRNMHGRHRLQDAGRAVQAMCWAS